MQQAVLAAAAQLEEKRIERHGIALQLLRHLFADGKELLPLPLLVQHLVRRQHFCLEAEGVLKLAVVYLGISRRLNQNAAVLAVLEGKGLADARALDADRDSRQLHGRAGNLEFHDFIFHIILPEICSYLVYCHFWWPSCFFIVELSNRLSSCRIAESKLYASK